MLPGQMKNPPPLDTPATTHPVSDSVPAEISSISKAARVTGSIMVIFLSEANFIFPPMLKYRKARFSAGPFHLFLVLVNDYRVCCYHFLAL